MATYEIWLTDDAGLRLTQLDDMLSLEASRAVNAIGACTLSVKPTFPEFFLKRDHMIQVWRAPAGGRLKLWRPYLLRWWEFSTKGSEETLEFGGPDVNELLRRRVVAAYAGSAEADKTDYADDMQKEVVSEALSDAADPTPDAGTRVWAGLSVAGELSAGPMITKGFAWKQLLTSSGSGVLPAIARAAREAGTEVFFDVQVSAVTSTSIAFEFRTFTGQPGADRTGSTVFSQERGNLADPQLLFDYREEENYIYGAGRGREDDRAVEQEYDVARYGASIWNRCEGMADARDQDDGAVQDAARERLYQGRGRISFTGVPLDVKGTRFGMDWDFGDQVRARYRNQEFDAIVRGVVLKVGEDGKEKIGARLDYEGVA